MALTKVTYSMIEGSVINVLDYGADPTGSADSTTAIQSALDLGLTVYMPAGTYKTTAPLVLKNGSKIVGEGNYSGIDTLTVYPTAIYEGTTVIKYDGTSGADVAVIRVSAEAVGTEPTDVDTRNMVNVGIENIVIDGNEKAGIGLYLVRALLNNKFDYITVTNTTAHAFLAMICFGGNVNNWCAFMNIGAGITIGRNVYSWTAYGVDQTQFNSCYGFRNGFDSARVAQNAFSDATPNVEYGIGVYRGRDLVFINAQSTYNGGVGIYCETDRWPVKFIGCYLEFNCQSSAATSKWGIWFQGVTGNVSRHVNFDSVYLNGPSGQIDGIRLTGTEPSRAGEDAVVFNQIPQLSAITADWGNYRLIDCDSNVVITGTLPYMIAPVLNAHSTQQLQQNMGISGATNFNVSGGAISSSRVTGVVSSVAYTSTGVYTVTFNQTLDSTGYTVVVTGSPDLLLGIQNKTTTGFEISSLNRSGVASDSGIVNVIILGFWNL